MGHYKEAYCQLMKGFIQKNIRRKNIDFLEVFKE